MCTVDEAGLPDTVDGAGAEPEDVHAALRTEACLLLESLANDADHSIDEPVLAWTKLKSWGQGKAFAICRKGDLAAPRANVIQLPAWDQKGLEAVQKKFVVASQQQCADDLDVEVSLVRSAAACLVKRGLLTMPYVRSRALATKHKLGVVSGLV